MNNPKIKGKKVRRWYWCGFPGHFICGHRCVFHLATVLPSGYLVSTLGAMMNEKKEVERIGGGENDYYESMVFECDGLDESGNPMINSLTELECKRYPLSTEAEDGHYHLCEKWSEI